MTVSLWSLFESASNVMKELSQPNDYPWAAFPEMHNHVNEIVAHATSQMICELVNRCSPSRHAGDSLICTFHEVSIGDHETWLLFFDF